MLNTLLGGKTHPMHHWLDFSGATPLLIPKRLVPYWHGVFDTLTGAYSELNTKAPRTDYDRACIAAWPWPGRGVVQVGDGSALALYTEFDEHTWDHAGSLVACGSWMPSRSQLENATWSDSFTWETKDTEFFLMNSAASGFDGLKQDDFLEVSLIPGVYSIEYANLEAEYVGCFHRFSLCR